MAFYEKEGFRRTGRREDYYRDPREAALVFEKNEDSTRLVPNTS
jgi:ribosomal protein S18 acetylase RimI-like enzyme